MKEDLLPYYEHELGFIRQMGKEFGEAYGRIAGALRMESDDPHIERLIQGFAFLAGRVHHKIDDEFPEITEALLGVLYPHFLRPIPTMSIAQFRADPEQVCTGFSIARGSGLYTSPIAGRNTACNFQTCYPVTLWPLEVTGADLPPAASVVSGSDTEQVAAILRIRLKCSGPIPFSALKLERLRFFLSGDSGVANVLYELLLNNTHRVEIRREDETPVSAFLPDDCVQPVGFGFDEGLLPYPERSFLGYRLIQEYFVFPEKFLFFDLCGFDRIERSGFGDDFQILIQLRPFERKNRLRQLEQNVNRETFQLGCTPIVNLFDRLAEPIRLTHALTEYRVVGDRHRESSTEVYSVNRVLSAAPYLQAAEEYMPFYSVRHAYDDKPASAYWYASRKISERNDDKGTEVYISLVNLKFQPSLPPTETLHVYVTCTNRDLAGELPLTGRFGELSMDSGSVVRIRTLVPPSKTQRPPLRRGLQWRLISHLALNYLSVVQGGRDAIQEVLKLYDFSEDQVVRQQIAGIAAVSSAPHVARVISQNGVVFAQGVRVDMEFDEDEFVGSGVFLFAAVMERFLGLYSSINSFSQLTARTRQRKEVLRKWAPRSGEQILL